MNSLMLCFIINSFILIIYIAQRSNFAHSMEMEIGQGIQNVENIENVETIWSCVLYRMGGRVLPPIKYRSEYYRILFSLFLHKHWVHLLSNICFLTFSMHWISFQHSPTKRLAQSFLLSTLANLISVVISPFDLTVGISPIIFCFLGQIAILMLLRLRKGYTLTHLQILVMSLLIFIFSFHEESDTSLHLISLAFGVTLEAITQSFQNLYFFWITILFAIFSILSFIELFYHDKNAELSSFLSMGCTLPQ